MNRSKPSSVRGGGEIYRVTSSLVSIARSGAASVGRSCLTVCSAADRTGSWRRQSLPMVTRLISGVLATEQSARLQKTAENREYRPGGPLRSRRESAAGQTSDNPSHGFRRGHGLKDREATDFTDDTESD